MARPTGYEPVLSSQAVSALVSLPRSKQNVVLGLIFRLALQPSQTGDGFTWDASGRDIQHLQTGDWQLSFWADHAVRELRVVEIAEL